MIGREEIDNLQARAMVIQALREVLMEPGFDVEDGENPYLYDDLDIDETCMADLVSNLEREFEITIPDDAAEEWVTFRDLVDDMKKRHNQFADDTGGYPCSE